MDEEIQASECRYCQYCQLTAMPIYDSSSSQLPNYTPLQGDIVVWQLDFTGYCHCQSPVAGVYKLYRNGKVVYKNRAI